MTLNAWLEVGREMQEILRHMSDELKDDLLPDWFAPRLTELLSQSPPRFYDLAGPNPAVCPACGSLVESQQQHTAWHAPRQRLFMGTRPRLRDEGASANS